jgi:hypothetical protein
MKQEAIIDAPAPDHGQGLRAAAAGTLDEIFRRNASRRPAVIALVDPPDRAAFTDAAPRRLTYAQADRAVSALAGRLQALGLPRDSVVALQLPNTVESVVALLAVLRAGMIAAPIPLLWRKAEASAALGPVGARALVTCTHVAHVDHAEVALQIAAGTFSIRSVAAFGTDLADGLVPLDDIFTAESGTEELATEGGDDRVSVITFDASLDGFVPVGRTDTELLVGGLTIILQAGIGRHATILSTLLMPSFAALATTVVAWLLTGGTLVLHQPFDPRILAEQCTHARVDAITLPGPLVHILAQAGFVGRRDQASAIVSVWRAPERQAGSPAWIGAVPLVDILAFGELGLVAVSRPTSGKPGAIPVGAITAPHGGEAAPVVITVARTPVGTLALGGPMLAQRAFLTGARAIGDGVALVDTGYPCSPADDGAALMLTGAPPGLVSVGGYRFALRELQDLIGHLDANSVLAALPDLLAGQKLAGSSPDRAAVRDALAALGINPLVGSAFRGRGDKSAPAA